MFNGVKYSSIYLGGHCSVFGYKRRNVDRWYRLVAGIIVSATKNAAEVCGLGRELGALERGKIADIFIIDGNPLKDLANLTKTKIVIKDGVIIKE
jgi:cytosine/adenosine deaminase-related metal-dependent hydrolase